MRLICRHHIISLIDFYTLQMIEVDKLQVKELRQQGYSDIQLQDLGFNKVALGLAPAVLKSS